MGIRLVETMGEDWYQKNVEVLARKMADTGKVLVYAVMLSNLGLNLLKLLLSGSLMNLNISVVIPLVPLILALAAYILGDYFESARKQSEDMSMII